MDFKGGHCLEDLLASHMEGARITCWAPWLLWRGYMTSSSPPFPLHLASLDTKHNMWSPHPTHVWVHFYHSVDALHMNYLSRGRVAPFVDDVDLVHSSNTLVSFIHDAVTWSFHTTWLTVCYVVGKIPLNPWFDDECHRMRSHLIREQAMGHLTRSEAQCISWCLTWHKRRTFLSHRMDEVIWPFRGGEHVLQEKGH